MSSSQYIQDAVRNVEAKLKKEGTKLQKNVTTPMSTNYRPECDISPKLTTLKQAIINHSLVYCVGWLRWGEWI